MSLEITISYKCNGAACTNTAAGVAHLDAAKKIILPTVPAGWKEVAKAPTTNNDGVTTFTKTDCYCADCEAEYVPVSGDMIREG